MGFSEVSLEFVRGFLMCFVLGFASGFSWVSLRFLLFFLETVLGCSWDVLGVLCVFQCVLCGLS